MEFPRPDRTTQLRILPEESALENGELGEAFLPALSCGPAW